MNVSCIVIDDDDNTVEIFSDLLETIGIKVVGRADNGAPGVELYSKLKPDIVFTDVMMPKFDGFYVVEKIREINSQAKIVAITADDSEETLQRLGGMNISAVLHKPFSLESLRQTITDELEIKLENGS